MDIDDFPRRAFDPAVNKFDAKACGTTVNRVANFKAHHRLSQDQRLSPDACAQLTLELETDERVAKGEQLRRARALALIANRATAEAAAALAAALPQDRFHYVSPEYLLNRVEDLTGKRYVTAGAHAFARATALAPVAAIAGEAFKCDTCHRCLFWGVILRLDQLPWPPPTNPEAFYSWSQLDAYKYRARANLGDLITGRMQEGEARSLLDLPATGPLAPKAIKDAYRTQARTTHPDAGGDCRQFARVSAARDRLMLAADG